MIAVGRHPAATDSTIIIPGHGKPVSNKSELRTFATCLSIFAIMLWDRRLAEPGGGSCSQTDHGSRRGAFTVRHWPSLFTAFTKVYESSVRATTFIRTEHLLEMYMSFAKTKDGIEIFYQDWGRSTHRVPASWPLSADDWDAQMLFSSTRAIA